MSEFPRNDLEAAMQHAAEDAALRPQFYSALLDSTIYVIGDAQTDMHRDEFRISAGDTLTLASFTFEDGEPYIPFFTSLEALTESVSGEVSYMSFKARELFDSTRGNSFVLNPGQPLAKEFTPEEITGMLEGRPEPDITERQLDAGTEVHIGQPADYPVDMVDALTRLFSRHGIVRRAYLAQLLVPEKETEQLSLLVALDIDGEPEKTYRDMEIVIADTAPPGRPVDITLLTGGDNFVDNYFQTADVAPFYERSWGQRLKGFFVRG